MHPHLYNGIKYGLSILAMCFFWSNPTYAVLQFVYTLYALNWDLREDWGAFVLSLSTRPSPELQKGQVVSSAEYQGPNAVFALRGVDVLRCHLEQRRVALLLGSQTLPGSFCSSLVSR